MTPLLEEHRNLVHRVLMQNGADPFRGRQHRRLLLDAGFTRTEGSATVTASGSPAACRANAEFMTAQFAGIAKTALAQGWVDQETLDAMAAEIDAWANQPDAFNATTFCETIGWRDD
jgi:hypothetical protein